MRDLFDYVGGRPARSLRKLRSDADNLAKGRGSERSLVTRAAVAIGRIYRMAHPAAHDAVDVALSFVPDALNEPGGRKYISGAIYTTISRIPVWYKARSPKYQHLIAMAESVVMQRDEGRGEPLTLGELERWSTQPVPVETERKGYLLVCVVAHAAGYLSVVTKIGFSKRLNPLDEVRAYAGKFGGCSLIASFQASSWVDAFSIELDANNEARRRFRTVGVPPKPADSECHYASAAECVDLVVAVARRKGIALTERIQ